MEIKERYCSFEVSKLLQERGFEQHKCQHSYDSKGVFKWSDDLDPYECSAPTHQMACAWIRNEHDIDMWVEYCIPDDAYVYTILIKDITEGFTIIHSEDNYPTYEEATEAGLKYSLENLI